MKRRELLHQAVAASTLCAAAGSRGAGAVERGAPVPRGSRQAPALQGRMLVNRPRAQQVMERLKLDGIVALNPINVYYLANTLPIGARMRWELPAFATLPRDPRQPSFLVTATPEAWDIVNGDREVPELVTYSGASDAADYLGADAQKLRVEPRPVIGGYVVREGAALTPREQRWADSQKRYNAQASPSPAWALARALRESGLGKARIAVDDLRIKYLLEQIGMTDVECVPGDGVFRLIRMVKSEPEIALMRVAGRNNGIAAMNTIRSIERGMTYRDVEQRFRAECGALGNDVAFILAGVTLGLFPDGVAVPGKPFLVDAVSRFREYHGDFSRTVCLGEPPPEVVARARANKVGRDALFEIVKPGVTFSELRRVGTEAMVKAGMPKQILIVNPHSVGLQHTDHPTRLDAPLSVPMPIDHVLEENMTITIDLPYVEVGWGAGHNEDLIRITKNGFELLNDLSDPLVIV